MKYCWSCKTSKPIDQWPKNKAKKDGLGTECKLCVNVKQKAWYARKENADKHKQNLYVRRTNNKAKLVEHFGDKCLDCGGTFPSCVYDFHHLDPNEKDRSFGQINTGSWKKIAAEIIGKCVMLCSNCHRIRHHAE